MLSRIPTFSATTLTFLVVFGYVLIYLLPLGVRPLISPDETRYAEIPREMVARSEWIVPRLNGLRYFEKPPMGYWANAVSLMVFGENNFAVRAVGALSAGLIAIWVYFLGLRTGAERKTALLGAAVYLSFAEVYLVGTFSVLDNLLAVFLCAGFATFHASMEQQQPRLAKWMAFWSGVAFGCAFLTKGFLGFVLPVIVVLPWLFWCRRVAGASPAIGLVLVGAALVSLPWVVMVYLQEADFWRYFFFEEHVRRFLSDNAQHKQPFFYFLMLLPGLAFPWVFLAPAACAGLHALNRTAPARSTMRFLWVWLAVPFVFFSASSGKLTTYILPCFAPGAVLIAVGLMNYLALGRRKFVDLGLAAVLIVMLGLLGFLLIAQLTSVVDAVYQRIESRQLLVAFSVVFFATLFTVWALRAVRPHAKLAGLFLGITSLFAVAQFVTPISLLERKAPGLLLAQYADKITPDTLIVSDSGVVRAVSWYLKRDDVYLIAGGELTYGLAYLDSESRLLNPQTFRDLLSTTYDVLLACKRRCPDTYTAALPATIEPHTVGLFVLWYAPGHETADLIAGP